MASNAKNILIVDDEARNRDGLKAMVEALGFRAETASDGIEAVTKLRLDIDLVLLDAMMPGMDGFEVAKRIRQNQETSDVPIIMITALGDKKDRIRAVQAGVSDFLSKPVDFTELEVRMASLLKIKEGQDALKRYQMELEERVERRTSDLRAALKEVTEAQRQTNQAHLDTIRRLVVAAEYKDEDTAAHIQRMSHYCALLGRNLGLSPGEAEILLHASSMHDVGKIGIPDAVLLKPGKLDPDEWKIMKEHTLIGDRILKDSPSEYLREGEVIALTHHEKWDGYGYPRGLKGKDIPLWGRICAVADVFDALTSDRPYKKAFPNEKAFAILREGRGAHFDPEVIDVFFDRLGEIVKIQERYGETNGTAGPQRMG